MKSFLEFYNNLDTFDLVLLWVGIFVLIIVVILSFYLYKKNKQLVNLVKRQEKELTNMDKLIEDNKVKAKEVRDKLVEIKKESKIENDKIDNIVEEKIKDIEEEKIYKKNVLRDDERRYQTSPINIVKKEKKIEEKENISFTEQLAKKMEEEIKPQTIELTDFEKKQEEEAIISYKELLSSSKNKVYNITDDEETTDFIEELKSFRSDL